MPIQYVQVDDLDKAIKERPISELIAIIQDKSGLTPLHYAVLKNKLHLVKQLLAAGAEVDKKDQSYGATALIYAANGGRGAIVDCLLNAGANPNAVEKYGETALMSAVQGEYTDCFLKLIRAGANLLSFDLKGKNVLTMAIQRVNHAMLSMILMLAQERKYPIEDLKVTKALMILVQKSYDSFGVDLRLRVEYGAPSIDLRLCARVLIAAGADLLASTPNGQNVLTMAAEHVDHDMLSMILMLAHERKYSIEDLKVTEALKIVVQKPHDSFDEDLQLCAEILVEAGADVHTTINGKPLLAIAFEKHHQNFVALLIKAGADPISVHIDDTVGISPRQNGRDTLLMHAGFKGQCTTIEAIIDYINIHDISYEKAQVKEVFIALAHAYLSKGLSKWKDTLATFISLGQNPFDIDLEGKSLLVQATALGHEALIICIAEYMKRHGIEPKEAKLNEAFIYPIQNAQSIDPKKCFSAQRRLLSSNADINCIIDGETPLTKACKVNSYDFVKFLIEESADPRIANNKGELPSNLTKEDRAKDLVSIAVSLFGRKEKQMEAPASRENMGAKTY